MLSSKPLNYLKGSAPPRLSPLRLRQTDGSVSRGLISSSASVPEAEGRTESRTSDEASTSWPYQSIITRGVKGALERVAELTGDDRLKNPDYYRDLFFSIVEFVAAILAWRGIWDYSEDIIPGTRPEDDLIIGVLGLAVLVSVGTLSSTAGQKIALPGSKEEETREEAERTLGMLSSPPEVEGYSDAQTRPPPPAPLAVGSVDGDLVDEDLAIEEIPELTRSPSPSPAPRRRGGMFRMGSIATQPVSVFQDLKNASEAKTEDAGAKMREFALEGLVPLASLWKPWRAYQDIESLPMAFRPGTSDAVMAEADEADPDRPPVRELEARFVHERIGIMDARIRARGFFQLLSLRRSIRQYSTDHVPLEILEDCIRAAGTAPSALHSQPWKFVVVADKGMKRKIRKVIETDSRAVASGSASQTQIKIVVHGFSEGDVMADRAGGAGAPGAWADPSTEGAAPPAEKPPTEEGIEAAPYMVVLMEQQYREDEQGRRTELPRSSESCGLAAGIFVAALHNANLSTATISPTEEARELIRQAMGRPEEERVFMVLPVGYPSAKGSVPYRRGTSLRKPLSQSFLRPDGIWSESQFTLKRVLARTSYEEIVREKGPGFNAELLLCQDNVSGSLCVLKAIRETRMLAPLRMTQLHREASIHLALDHPSIVKMYAVFEEKGSLIFVLEHAARGDMHTFLSSYGSIQSERRAVVQFIEPLLSALNYLHRRGVIHRDVKPENIFLSSSETVLLGDFGLALNSLLEKAVTRLGTLSFAPPEVLSGVVKSGVDTGKEGRGYGPSADIWSFGLCVSEILGVGGKGSKHRSGVEVAGDIQRVLASAQGRNQLSAEAIDFISRCLAIDSAARPSSGELLNHRFITKYVGRAAGGPGTDGSAAASLRPSGALASPLTPAGPGPSASPKPKERTFGLRIEALSVTNAKLDPTTLTLPSRRSGSANSPPFSSPAPPLLATVLASTPLPAPPRQSGGELTVSLEDELKSLMKQRAMTATPGQ